MGKVGGTGEGVPLCVGEAALGWGRRDVEGGRGVGE